MNKTQNTMSQHDINMKYAELVGAKLAGTAGSQQHMNLIRQEISDLAKVLDDGPAKSLALCILSSLADEIDALHRDVNETVLRQPVKDGKSARPFTMTQGQLRAFDRAMAVGLMAAGKTSRYEWRRSKALLAYFLGRVFCGDRPRHCAGELLWEKGGLYMPTAHLEALFGERRVGTYRNKRQNMPLPPGHELVEHLMGD